MTAAKKLKRWLEQHDMSPHAFAMQNQIDPSHLSKVLREEVRKIGVSMALAIEKGTNRAVKCEDWV